MTQTDIEGGVTSTYTLTYTLSGNTINLTINSGVILAVSYSINGTTLVINYTDPDDGCNVTATYVGAA